MPLQKDWHFFFSQKNLMSSETESIVKYLFLRLLCFILAQVSPANFNPFKCLQLAGNLPPPFINIRISHLSCQMGHTGCEIGLCFHFQRRVVFYICGIVEYEVLVCLLLRGKHMCAVVHRCDFMGSVPNQPSPPHQSRLVLSPHVEKGTLLVRASPWSTMGTIRGCFGDWAFY